MPRADHGGRFGNNSLGALLHDANDNIPAPPMGRQVAPTSTWLMRLPKSFFRLWLLLANTAAFVDEVGAPLRRWRDACAVKSN